MGRGISVVKKNVSIAAAVVGIVIFLVFAVGCSGDLLGYIKDMIAQAEYKGIELPKTGQTTSHLTGDDGDLRMGVAWPDPRFTVGTGVETGCITDNLTGLMWDQSGDTSIGKKTWSDALIDCSGLSLGGHSDWRLPNLKELRSLVNYQQSDQAVWLNGQGFTGVQVDSYWSSTTSAPSTSTSAAWFVVMGFGDVEYSNKTFDYYVLAVRSGQAGGTVSLPKTGQATSYTISDGEDGDLRMGVAWPSPRFTNNGDGTITDNLTGLMWDESGDTSIGQKTWSDALIDCNGLSLGGYDDWRLPNVNELESLINAGKTDSAAWLNGQGFTGVQAAGDYWSSTTSAPPSTNAWYVSLSNGYVIPVPKTGDCYVLAVRSGQ